MRSPAVWRRRSMRLSLPRWRGAHEGRVGSPLHTLSRGSRERRAFWQFWQPPTRRSRATTCHSPAWRCETGPPLCCVTQALRMGVSCVTIGWARYSISRSVCLILLAHRGRFELPTPRFVVWCSIQLSYRCLSFRFRNRISLTSASLVVRRRQLVRGEPRLARPCSMRAIVYPTPAPK
jgi:hypothetical protein